MTMTSTIAVQDVVRRFGRIEAVTGVSFHVAAGEVFGFLGPNGAGKTTTINMLCTLLRPTSGSATVNGFDVVRQRSAVRRSIGLVFQQSTLDDSLNAKQNLRFHAFAYGMPANIREQRIRELLAPVELWDRRRGSVWTFSGGMRRRLEIARGLLHHPRVLFLDEPTLGLDPLGTTARLVMGLLLVGSVVHGQLVTHLRPATWALGLMGFPALVLAWHAWHIRRTSARFSYTSPLSFALGVLLFLALYLTWWYAPALSVTSDAALLFFGGSMLLAALRGDAGCELLALSNWLLRRHDQIACAVFAPIDALERRGARS